MKNLHRDIIKIVFLSSVIMASTVYGYYTTKGQDIINRKTGEKVQLQGFGLGCWLLPEGYMWGLRTLDRPRQFEKAVVDLIGPQDANEFWRLYHDNFVTEGDIKAMKEWGVNSVRIALLASMLQPRDGQPAAAPYLYSEEGFSYLDNLVRWCDKYKVGIIWDMHGIPAVKMQKTFQTATAQLGFGPKRKNTGLCASTSGKKSPNVTGTKIALSAMTFSMNRCLEDMRVSMLSFLDSSMWS